MFYVSIFFSKKTCHLTGGRGGDLKNNLDILGEIQKKWEFSKFHPFPPPPLINNECSLTMTEHEIGKEFGVPSEFVLAIQEYFGT